MYGPRQLYNSTVEHKNVRKSPYTPDDGPVWPKHIINLHGGTEYVLFRLIFCTA
jgi:hypothetical protein